MSGKVINQLTMFNCKYLNNILVAGVIIASLWACSDKSTEGVSDADTNTGTDVEKSPDSGNKSSDSKQPPAPAGVFKFGIDPSQTISSAPFPNNLYLNDKGLVDLKPLEEDEVISQIGNTDRLARMSEVINTRKGFGFSSSIYFFMAAEPDLKSFENKVTMVALDGPEIGKVLEVEVFWHQGAQSLGIFPAWGHYMMADSTYAVLISKGVKTTGNMTIEAPEGLIKTLAENDSDASDEYQYIRSRYAPVREHLVKNGQSVDDIVAATVFTTEPVFEHGKRLKNAVDAFKLEKPSLRVGYDTETKAFIESKVYKGADTDKYFGVPQPPFEFNPGRWDSGYRAAAEKLPGVTTPYSGGTGHFEIAAVINGSIISPALNVNTSGATYNRAPISENGDTVNWSEKYMVPFILYLCKSHINAPKNVPVAIFNHGGGALRSDSVAMANVNCLNGIATIAPDMIFHGGRRETQWLSDQNLVVPITADKHNRFIGLSEGEEGYVPDHVGDGGGAAASVAPLVAADYDLDPLIIEANLLQVSMDSYALVRYLKEGDWSDVLPGLSFDAKNIFHNALSFGTCFNTALTALSDDFKASINTVGTSMVLSANMPMAPTNAVQASAIFFLTLGLKSPPEVLQARSHHDPIIAIHQWLHQRGDPLAWAPYVLRHRQSDHQMHALSTGNSWDETLHAGAQMTFNNAYGFQTLTSTEDWTMAPGIFGADAIKSVPYKDAKTPGQVTYDNRTHSAALFFSKNSCHAQMINAICTNSYKLPYPPVVQLEEKTVFESRICPLQHQYKAFSKSLIEGNTPKVIAPEGNCEALYKQ